VILAATHGLVEGLDGEHAMAIVLEYNEVPDFNDVCAGELPPAIVAMGTVAADSSLPSPPRLPRRPRP
jgi:hypothetical protein